MLWSSVRACGCLRKIFTISGLFVFPHGRRKVTRVSPEVLASFLTFIYIINLAGYPGPEEGLKLKWVGMRGKLAGKHVNMQHQKVIAPAVLSLSVV